MIIIRRISVPCHDLFHAYGGRYNLIPYWVLLFRYTTMSHDYCVHHQILPIVSGLEFRAIHGLLYYPFPCAERKDSFWVSE
jgi:hypothetical protein